MRIEWMEEKIKTPRRRVFLFIFISASRRLCVENCLSIRSHQICSRANFSLALNNSEQIKDER
jgi:hypothetical protein